MLLESVAYPSSLTPISDVTIAATSLLYCGFCATTGLLRQSRSRHSLSASIALTSVQDVPPCTFIYSKLLLAKGRRPVGSDLLPSLSLAVCLQLSDVGDTGSKNKSESDWPSASAASACSYSSWFVDHHDFGRLQQLHTRGTSESAPLMAVPRSSHSCSLWSRLRPSASHGPSGGYCRQSTAFNCSQLMACRQCSTADAVGLTAAAVGLQRCRHPAGAFNLLERPWPLLVDCWLAPAVFSASEGASSSEL